MLNEVRGPEPSLETEGGKQRQERRLARRFPLSARAGRCMRVDDASLFTADQGEFGGGLEVRDRRGRRKVFSGNRQRVPQTSIGVVAIGGLTQIDHWGFLGEIRFDAEEPRVASVACLPSDPRGAAVDADGTLIVVIWVLQYRESQPPPH